MKLGAWIINVTFLLTIAIPSKGQSNTLIVGKWRFERLHGAENQELMSPDLMHFVLGNNSYRHFFTNHLYTEYSYETAVHGRWKLVDNARKLVMTSFNGDISTYEITKLTIDTLVLSGKKAFVTFVKDANAIETYVEEPPLNSVPVKATAHQICKRWEVKDARLVSESTEAEKLASSFVGNAIVGSWYDFKSDGLVLMRFMSLKKEKWYFENENKSIAVVDESGNGSTWNIISISDSELILQKPHANNQLLFSAQSPIPLQGENDPLLMSLGHPDYRTVYAMPDVSPQFPGGRMKMDQWIKENRNPLPQDQIISGTVDITALVDITGELMRAKVMRSVNKEQDSEALRLVNLMPFWKPAYIKNRPVISSVIISVSFRN